MIDPIDLPSPQPLLPSLLKAGFSHEIASTASQLYQQRAEEFKRRTETTLIGAWHKMATLPGASVSLLDPLTRKDVSNFTQVYLRCLDEWREEMVQLLKQASLNAPSKAGPPRNSRSFNHVGTLIDGCICSEKLAGVFATIGALLRREPISDTRRQSLSRQKVKYAVQANSCMGEDFCHLGY